MANSTFTIHQLSEQTDDCIELTAVGTWTLVHTVPDTTDLVDEVSITLMSIGSGSIDYRVEHPDVAGTLLSGTVAAVAGADTAVLDKEILPQGTTVLVKATSTPGASDLTGDEELYVPTTDGIKIYTADAAFTERSLTIGSGTSYVGAIPVTHKNGGVVIGLRTSSTTVDIFDLGGNSLGTLTLSTAMPATLTSNGGEFYAFSGTDSDGDYLAFHDENGRIKCIDMSDADPDNWTEAWEYNWSASFARFQGIYYNETYSQFIVCRTTATNCAIGRFAEADGTLDDSQSDNDIGNNADFFVHDRATTAGFAFGAGASGDADEWNLTGSTTTTAAGRGTNAGHFDYAQAAGLLDVLDGGNVAGLFYDTNASDFRHASKMAEDASNTNTSITGIGANVIPEARSRIFALSTTELVYEDDNGVLTHVSGSTFTQGPTVDQDRAGGIGFERRTTPSTITLPDGGLFIKGQALRVQ